MSFIAPPSLDQQVFFLTGLPKSGTTWMMNILNSFDEICCLGEGRFFGGGLEDAPCLYDAMATGLRPWHDFIALRKKNWLGYDQEIVTAQRRNYLPKQFQDEAFRSVLDLQVGTMVSQLMSNVVKAKPQVQWIGDKTPVWNSAELERVGRIFPEAKIVFLRRDVRDFVVSLLFHYWRATRDMRPDRLMPMLEHDDFLAVEKFVADNSPEAGLFISPATARRLALLWKETNGRAEALASQRPQMFLWVDYEALCENPHEVMMRIYAFLGFSPTALQSDLAIEKNSKNSIQQKGDGFLKEHVRSGVPGDWRYYLPPEISETIAVALK